jgi:hypothetical protein
MLTMRFVLAHDPERFGTGWRPAHQPDFDPTGGMGVAHDVLEHFPGDDGSLKDELQAFGAILLIRVEHGDLDPKSLAVEFPDLMSKLFHGDTWLEAAPRTRLLSDDLEMFMARALIEARKQVAEFLYDDDLTYEDKIDWFNEQVPHIMGWMRVGYRRARRRYRNAYSYHDLPALFGEIARMADQELKECDGRLGTELTIRVSTVRSIVRCSVREPDDY